MFSRTAFSAMISGLVWILGIILLASLVISLLLTFTSLAESDFTVVTLGISFLALFIGGFIAGRKGGEKGWFVGGATGLLYTLLIFLIQYLGFDSGLSGKQTLYFALYILTSALGGMIGVNLTKSHPARRG